MRHRYATAWLVLVLLMGLAAGATALAQEDGAVLSAPVAGYSIDWATIDGGGGSSAGGTYSLSATIGQADAGPRADGMAGGSFALKGGFWTAASRWAGHRYLPMIVRE